MILIDLSEYFTDLFLRVLLVFKKRSYLIVGYNTWVINIKIGKCLLKMGSIKSLRLKGSYNELGEVNHAGVVGINNSHKKIDSILIYFFFA